MTIADGIALWFSWNLAGAFLLSCVMIILRHGK